MLKAETGVLSGGKTEVINHSNYSNSISEGADVESGLNVLQFYDDTSVLCLRTMQPFRD